MIITSGGIGGNYDLVKKNWPARLGAPPKHMLTGVPAHVDGRMLEITENAGGNIVNRDRMWHYTEGITNYDPVWPNHGIRILPGPSSLWLDATGKRLPVPLFPPGFDTLGTLEHIVATGYDHTWFVLDQKIIEKEFGLSGSEQNPDLTGRDIKLLLQRVRSGAPGPVEAFKQRGVDFVVRDNLADLVAGMNELTPGSPRSTTRRSGRWSRPATARSPTSTPRTCRSRRCARHAPIFPTGSRGSRRRTASSIRRPGRSSR